MTQHARLSAASRAPLQRDGRAWRSITTAARRPPIAIPLALLLVAVIGVADYLTGYEVRLAFLYVVPVVLATWTCGRVWGLLIAILGPILWAASFASLHAYSHDIYFYWDCVVMGATFLLFVELLVRLRAALARSDERFVRVLENLYAAVYVTDDEDRVVFANRRLAMLLGSDPRGPTVDQITARFAAMPSDSAAARDGIPGSPFVATEARDLIEGRWYVVQAGSIPWVDRRRVHLNVMTDITDQKQAQQLRREQEAALHHTARLMNLAEAGATLAHELNQPLTAIVGYNAACIRLLESDAADKSELRAAMERLRAQAVRAGEIVQRLRELTRRRAPRLAACDLNTMVRQTLRWAESDLERARVEVELHLAERLPPARADRLLIEQVMLNLVQNAIDAMRDCEQSRRRLHLTSALADDGSVIVTVSDRGAGISAGVAARLYTPFFTTKEQGLGLGLSICRSVVEMHGGKIWHATNDRGGASFRFTLPSGDA
jgi:C4-dicarboxylate-specific signal transduction histidine kinase